VKPILASSLAVSVSYALAAGQPSNQEKSQKKQQMGQDRAGQNAMPSFADIDSNNDGSISPEEFSAYQALQHQQMGQ